MKIKAALCLVLLGTLAQAQDDPAKAIKSKEFETRKSAVLELSKGGHDKAAKLLTGALKDDDWEIAELAANGLGELGEEAGAGALKALLRLSLDGPVFRLRRAAASAMGRIDPATAAEELAKKLSSKDSHAAAEALVEIGPAGEERKAPKSIKKAAEKGKEYGTRRAAAMAVLVVGAEDRSENLTALLEHEELGVRAAALDAVRAAPAAGDLEPVGAVLARPRLVPVIERRALWAARAILWTMESDDARAQAVTGLLSGPLASDQPSIAVRAPRLLGHLLSPPRDTYGEFVHGRSERFEPAWILEQLAPLLAHASADVRAAAARTLGLVATEAARERAFELGATDRDARVRRVALAAALVAPTDGGDAERDDESKLAYDEVTAQWLIERIKAENDARTREDLVVALGVKDFQAAVAPLAGALGDSDPWVAVCAAVSLGKTRLEAAVPLLAALLKNDDWKLRGAAVVGLGQSFQKAAVPHLIASVEDPVPVIGRTAHEVLLAFSAQESADRSRSAWEAWWEEKEKSLRLVDPETADERAKKYGYSTDWDRIYGGLDLVVLESRGDHIQNIMTKLEIDHRLTQAASIVEDEVHSQAVFVANCTGEIESADVEHLSWFLRTGGYLFGSCWALHETIEKIYPGVIRKYEASGEVLDLVTADSCAQDSPYLEGVFAPGVRPLYSLVGAHLIEVLDPERAEVLIDSPECAERWGSGDLAVWFPAGHGVVLDSVNHFEEQGLTQAKGLKGAEMVQAYAIDHLGLTYEELRASKKEKFWGSPSRAAGEVLDLSVFRLVTNFVRIKRLEGR